MILQDLLHQYIAACLTGFELGLGKYNHQHSQISEKKAETVGKRVRDGRLCRSQDKSRNSRKCWDLDGMKVREYDPSKDVASNRISNEGPCL